MTDPTPASRAKVVLGVAHRNEQNNGETVITLSTGIRARLHPVAATLIEDVIQAIPEPSPPIVMIEEKGREEPNPFDPAYIRAVRECNIQRALASIDVMLMFGVELVDNLPEDDDWLNRLRWLAKRGVVRLADYDLEQPLDREFLFKRYFAVGTKDLVHIGSLSGLTQEDVAQAAHSFRGNATQEADK